MRDVSGRGKAGGGGGGGAESLCNFLALGSLALGSLGSLGSLASSCLAWTRGGNPLDRHANKVALAVVALFVNNVIRSHLLRLDMGRIHVS